MTLTATSAQPHSLSSQQGSPRFIKYVHIMPLLAEIHPFILPEPRLIQRVDVTL